MNKFAVIISTYQRPDGKTPFYLNRCLNSLYKQYYKNFKVYVIGDKYEDKVEFNSILSNFINKIQIQSVNLPNAKEREKYLGKNNKALWMYGGVNATNHGINLAKNDGLNLICMLDHDDWWSPRHLRNLNEGILKTGAKFICSKSTHINGSLPNVKIKDRFINFLPKRRTYIKSSVCVNINEIPFLCRDLYEMTKECKTPADADMWDQISNIINKKNLKSYLVNEVTCYHDEEGYTKTIK